MRLSEKKLLRYTSICIAILTVSLLGLVLSSTMDPVLKIWGIVLTFSIGGASVMFYTLLSLQVRSELQALSETLQDLGNGVPITVVTEADTLLAKVHHQVVRLADILESHAKRHREEKESINALISDISHQLKTPLANLKMYYQLLLDSNLSAQERAGFTEHMQNQIEKLSWLLDSLLKMSRLETGIINQNPRRASIAQTVLQAIEMVSLAAEQKSIDVSFSGDLSIELCHDPKWTQEAVFNVLDNAVKYSPPGRSVSVSITTYELFCRIDITDQGPGIAEHEIGKVFSRFCRGENSRESPGLGLGLYLARKIIAEQGGYIKVTSALGQGATFSIFLPI